MEWNNEQSHVQGWTFNVKHGLDIFPYYLSAGLEMKVHAGTYALHSLTVLHIEEAISIAIRHYNCHSQQQYKKE